jgi:mRNA-degrading endonuclease toxin of MazEF toxin-antitoxin module
MRPGEIFWVDLETGRRPAIVVSREGLNRGAYVVAVLCTTAQFEIRRRQANCVAFAAGDFGLPKDCVAQCEAVTFVEIKDFDAEQGRIGVLDAETFRDLVKAIGFVIGSDCEP